jgi:hypothetical protein
VVSESEQIDAFTSALMKKYTGTGQCTGTGNKLNQALMAAGIDPKISNLKRERCMQLASHLVKNNISIDSLE